jgi:hypothetical protein
MRQDLVDVADTLPTRGVRIITRQAAARRPAAAQRPDAVNAAGCKRPIAPRFPAREALGLPRQIVQRARECGEPPAKTVRIKGIVGQRRPPGRDGNACGGTGYADARRAGRRLPPAAAAPSRQWVEQREGKRAGSGFGAD